MTIILEGLTLNPKNRWQEHSCWQVLDATRADEFIAEAHAELNHWTAQGYAFRVRVIAIDGAVTYLRPTI